MDSIDQASSSTAPVDSGRVAEGTGRRQVQAASKGSADCWRVEHCERELLVSRAAGVALLLLRNAEAVQRNPADKHNTIKGKKGKGAYTSLSIGNPSQSYGASPAIWDHTVLPATRHSLTQVNDTAILYRRCLF